MPPTFVLSQNQTLQKFIVFRGATPETFENRSACCSVLSTQNRESKKQASRTRIRAGHHRKTVCDPALFARLVTLPICQRSTGWTRLSRNMSASPRPIPTHPNQLRLYDYSIRGWGAVNGPGKKNGKNPPGRSGKGANGTPAIRLSRVARFWSGPLASIG